jgi:hypothetical protein
MQRTAPTIALLTATVDRAAPRFRALAVAIQ